MTDRFGNKIVVVTGGARGIGRAIAEGFAAGGARAVVIADMLDDAMAETVSAIAAMGGSAVAVRTDVSSSASVAALFERVASEFGRLDIAVNCAAVTGPVSLLADVEEDDFDRCIAIDLKGVWLCMRAEIRAMLPLGKGAIVNIASTAGIAAAKRASPYIAAKHGVLGLTKAAAIEYAKLGIRVNAVCPGVTESAQTAPILSDPARAGSMLRGVPFGRAAVPDEIASAVLWLASDEAAFAHGAAFVIDGGMTAQ